MSRFEEEKSLLKPLPAHRLDDCKRFEARVSKFSTILVQHNLYSVDSRLIGEWVEVRSYADHLEIWFAQRCVDRLPRLRGAKQHQIQYRHIIDWLVRKPGAFENYRYRDDLFPTTQFRLAYDFLKSQHPSSANKEYLQILALAAKESEEKVDQALRMILANEEIPSAALVEKRIAVPLPANPHIIVAALDLSIYDNLLEHKDFDYEQQLEISAY